MKDNIMYNAKEGIFTTEMEIAFLNEEMDRNIFLKRIAEGKIAIPANKNRKRNKYYAIGEGCTVKINVNLGISSECGSIEEEIKKSDLCKEFEVESVMDLSSGREAKILRKKLLEEYDFILGTVPVYDTALLKEDFCDVTAEDMLKLLEEQAESGIDFFTIHAGINRRTLSRFEQNERLLKIVSRGGAMLYKWMKENNAENPFYEFFDDVLDICAKHDVVISLGDSLRPGSIFDATDALQIEELINLGELTKRAWEKNVQVIIEGPGHIRANEIAANMIMEKKLCHGAPFYVLGPLTTDIAAGHDHIAAASGALIAAMNGADFLCYLTPAEHLRLPDLHDVREGIIAFKIAAHSANLAKGFTRALNRDYEMSQARAKLDWEGMFKSALDEKKAREYRKHERNIEECTMCGKLCAMKNAEN